MSGAPDRGWRQVELEAREQVSTDIQALELTPLEFGQHIAWSESLLGRTNGFTALHTVGFPQIGRAFTTCALMIPAPALWLPMTPAIARTMEPCQYCKAETMRLERERVA